MHNTSSHPPALKIVNLNEKLAYLKEKKGSKGGKNVFAHSLPFDIRLPASRLGSNALLSSRPVENICDNISLAKIRIRKMRLENRRFCPKKKNDVMVEISR